MNKTRTSKSQNEISRRELIKIFGGAAAFAWLNPLANLNVFAADNVTPWTDEWDRAIIENALKKLETDFDEKEMMLTSKVNDEYHYHTNVRSMTVHQTRESLDYAELLLEDQSANRFKSFDRAVKILDRVLSLQETKADSKYQGLWSYYLEEPLDKMSPPDPNWADFNGEHLLLILHRHAARLPEALKPRIATSIGLAAGFIMRRPMTMHYTNIAAKGTHVTLGAGEFLNDKKIKDYATNRLIKWAEAVDSTGSFYEFNSPTYSRVALSVLARMLLIHKDAQVLDLTKKLHRRMWLHLADHFHTATNQFAAPLSRSYGNDLGASLWLQKSLGNKIQFANLDEVKAGKATAIGEIGVLNYDCPTDLRDRFTEKQKNVQRREMFLTGDMLIEYNVEYKRGRPIDPLQGTTFFTPDYSLGTINYFSFWNQRRPLMAYYGGQKRPAKWMQLKVMNEGYDFSSALFYSAQNENSVLAAVNFRTPGGNKQPDLDPIENGEFKSRRVYLQFVFDNWDPKSKILVDGKSVDNDSFKAAPLIITPQSRVTLELEGSKMCITPRFSVFGTERPTFRLARKDNQLWVEYFLFYAREPKLLKWAEINEAAALFTLEMDGSNGKLEDFDKSRAKQLFGIVQEPSRFACTWQSSAGKLNLAAGKQLKNLVTQDDLFDARINGEKVPRARLSDELIYKK